MKRESVALQDQRHEKSDCLFMETISFVSVLSSIVAGNFRSWIRSRNHLCSNDHIVPGNTETIAGANKS